MSDLDKDTITFGKYKGLSLSTVLKDRGYCSWLLKQDWFKNYEYLFNRIQDYDPKIFFFKTVLDSENFLESYKYFNLLLPEELTIPLTDEEKKCYSFYYAMVQDIKARIAHRIDNFIPNEYDIKAPVNWLKKFEKDTELSRTVFKEFINSHELINIPYIIERVKKEGGIEYKGAKSFLIAKQNSEKQELYWEEILKKKYGENISSQFKFEHCIFDFLNISKNTIYECKLNLKDFNEDQYKKYKLTLNKYNVVYLIGRDCIINIALEIILSTDPKKYEKYKEKIDTSKKPSKFDLLIRNFPVQEIASVEIAEY